jgi:hypothetical protein
MKTLRRLIRTDSTEEKEPLRSARMTYVMRRTGSVIGH